MPNRNNNTNVSDDSFTWPPPPSPEDEFFEDGITDEELLAAEEALGIIEDGPEPNVTTVTSPDDEFRVRLSQEDLERFRRATENSSNRRIITISGGPSIRFTNPLADFYSTGTDTPKTEVTTDPETVVTLRNGNKAKFKDCANINGKYYLKTDKEITLDYFEPERYVFKGDCNTINATFDDNGYIINKIDFYDPRWTKRNTLVEVRDGKMHVMSDYNALPKQYYTECISSNIWYHNSIADKNVDTQKRMKIRARKATNIYKPSPFKHNLKKDYEMGIKSPSFIKTEGKRYTYGIEMETISGKLPQYLDDSLNYLAIRDGSLKDEDGEEYGYEYVTGVLIGDTGLLQTKKLCNALTKYCIVNKKCGLHQHTGGVVFTNELVVYLYKLHMIIEKQIFNMMPISRRNNEYCKKLKKFDFSFKESDFNDPNKYKSKIDQFYAEIYTYVSATGELPSAKANKKTQHPLGAKCQYNHSTARYCWINFVPAMFDTRGGGNKSKTLENRIHQGTTNFTKVKYWTLINMGLMWYAENYGKEIALNDEISLQHIMELAYPKQFREINDYIELRSAKFNYDSEAKNKQNELSDYNEIVEDSDLTFKSI